MEREIPWPHVSRIELLIFFDRDTGDSFQAREFKDVKSLLKEGHIIEAHVRFKGSTQKEVTSPLLWITKKYFKTSRVGNIFRYND